MARDSRIPTALHEAAHVVMAVRTGVQVLSASIRPADLNGQFGLIRAEGQVCTRRAPYPHPTEAAFRSTWTQAQALIRLAGNVAQELWDDSYDYWPSREQFSDHHSLVVLLRTINRGAPSEAAELVRSLRAECQRILQLDETKEQILAVMDQLVEAETISGDWVYRTLTNGKCGAMHPDHEGVRCVFGPHPLGYHCPRDALPYWERRRTPEDPVIEVWSGFEGLDLRRTPLSSMPGNYKRLKYLLDGNPGTDRIPAAWDQVFEACEGDSMY